MKDKLEVVVAAIKKSRNVMICSHVDPDGDSIGSQMAMASLLKNLGKQTAIVNRDPVPTKYKFLDPQGLVRDQLPEGFNPDTMVVLDCSSLDRVGVVSDLVRSDMVVIIIDHHQTMPALGDSVYLQPTASSTAELVVEVFKELEVPIGREQAVQLYTAILSDTGGFRFPNTSAKCLSTAAELVEQGADPHEVAVQVYEQRSESSLRLLGRALSKIEILEDKRISLVCLEKKDLEACDARPNEVGGIVDHLISLKGCVLGVLIREEPGEIVKVNLRSRGSVKANKIAEVLGGGGHPNAAGYLTRRSLSEARERVLLEIKKWL